MPLLSLALTLQQQPPLYIQLYQAAVAGSPESYHASAPSSRVATSSALVSSDAVHCILSRSGLPRTVLADVWNVVDEAQNGCLARDGLFAALALVALVQRGYPVSEAELAKLRELPIPQLRDVNDLFLELQSLRRQAEWNTSGITSFSILPEWIAETALDEVFPFDSSPSASGPGAAGSNPSDAVSDAGQGGSTPKRPPRSKSTSGGMAASSSPTASKESLPSAAATSIPSPTTSISTTPGDQTQRIHRAREVARRYNSSFSHILQWESIELALVREKSGLIFKHNTYTVISKSRGLKVIRRYTDFEALDDYLVRRYPFRILPQLPKKGKIGEHDDRFLESRQISLRRLLNFVGRHPVLKDDDALQFFLSDTSPDFLAKFKLFFKDVKEEPAIILPEGPSLTPEQIVDLGEKTRRLYDGFELLVQVCDRMILRSRELEADMHRLAAEFGESPLTHTWDPACAHCELLAKSFVQLGQSFGRVAQTAASKADIEEESVSDHLNYMLDVISSFKDLYHRVTDRAGKGSQDQHLVRASSFLKNSMRTLKGAVSKKDDGLETLAPTASNPHTSLAASGDIDAGVSIFGKDPRSVFARQCVALEARLLHIYLAHVPQAIQLLASSQVVGNQELSASWTTIRTIADGLLDS